MKKKKGFTLVELLGVIVILGILLLIGIPAVTNTLANAKKKTFEEYIGKVLNQTELMHNRYSIDSESSYGCYIYDITLDLELPNTGTFKGYILISGTIRVKDINFLNTQNIYF